MISSKTIDSSVTQTLPVPALINRLLNCTLWIIKLYMARLTWTILSHFLEIFFFLTFFLVLLKTSTRFASRESRRRWMTYYVPASYPDSQGLLRFAPGERRKNKTRLWRSDQVEFCLPVKGTDTVSDYTQLVMCLNNCPLIRRGLRYGKKKQQQSLHHGPIATKLNDVLMSSPHLLNSTADVEIHSIFWLSLCGKQPQLRVL